MAIVYKTTVSKTFFWKFYNIKCLINVKRRTQFQQSILFLMESLDSGSYKTNSFLMDFQTLQIFEYSKVKFMRLLSGLGKKPLFC